MTRPPFHRTLVAQACAWMIFELCNAREKRR